MSSPAGPSKGDPDDPENLLEPVTRAASGSGPGPAAPANTAAGADAATDAAGAAAVERIPLDEVSMMYVTAAQVVVANLVVAGRFCKLTM